MLFPWSLSTQTSSFSLSLDLDNSEGDQAISSLDVFPNRTVPIQIFGTDIASASDLLLRFEFDPTQVVYEEFTRANIVSGTSALTGKDFANIGITLSAGNASSGLIGTIRFRTTEAFSGTDIRLVRARLVRDGQTETVLMDLSITLRLAKPPSPDFDRSGTVGIPDFLLFVDAFGSRRGQDTYEAKYDLNVDGEIGIPDFLIFIDSFGKVVNHAPVFTSESSVMLSLNENTPSGQPIGDPISATDGDSDILTYSLSGADADSFAIDPNTGHIQTKGTYNFEQKDRYSVIVMVSDGEGGKASLEVNITIKDIEEAIATVPSNVVVEEGDSKLIVRWDAVPDEADKPPVTGYEVGYRERPDPFDAPRENSDEWAGIQKVSSQLDSLIITGLLNGQAYLVSVRTLVDGGISEWTSPVLGIPVIPAAGPVFLPPGGGGTPPPPPPPRPPQPPQPPPPGPNQAPTFTDGPSTSRSVAENTASNQNIQHPVSATDADRHSLTYRLSGDDAGSFTIHAGGQLRTRSGVIYDYEEKNSYEVILRVEDGQGGTATIAVTIHVADVNEPPERPSAPRVEAASSTSLTVSWTEPTNTGPDIDDYDVQYREGDSGAFTPWSHNSADRTATIANLTQGTSYEVQVKAHNAEGWSDWSNSGTGSTSANQAPTFTDGASTSRSVAENTASNQNIQHPVSATDADRHSLTYRLSGDDAGSFTIHAGGQLRTRSGVIYDYEEKNSYEVILRVEDGQGGTATIAVTIHVADVNEPPERPSAPRVEAASSTSLTVSWTEPTNTGPDIDDYDVQYREGDSGAFTPWSHNSADRTATIANLTQGTSYEVQVKAHNAEGWSDWSNSGTGSTSANQAPTFTDGASTSRSVAENTASNQNIQHPVSATDADRHSLTYRLSGDDAGSFTIHAGGQLRTRSGVIYDYEEKNSYEVILRVEDGQGGTATIAVTIHVADVNEPPERPSAPRVEAASSTSLTVSWTEPTNTGPDIDDYDVQYREGDSGAFTPWSHNSADRTATIANLTQGTSYEVQVKAHNAEGWSDWSNSGTGSTSANQAPTFNDRASTSRSIAENTTGTHNIGDPVAAIDLDSDVLTYTLGGDDADSFDMVTSTGQLQTRDALDYEDKNTYTITVSVSDGKDAKDNPDATIDDNITVTITVTNVDEDGTVSILPVQPQVGTVLRARLSDPDGDVRSVR